LAEYGKLSGKKKKGEDGYEDCHVPGAEEIFVITDEDFILIGRVLNDGKNISGTVKNRKQDKNRKKKHGEKHDSALNGDCGDTFPFPDVIHKEKYHRQAGDKEEPNRDSRSGKEDLQAFDIQRKIGQCHKEYQGKERFFKERGVLITGHNKGDYVACIVPFQNGIHSLQKIGKEKGKKNYARIESQEIQIPSDHGYKHSQKSPAGQKTGGKGNSVYPALEFF
jgi:hypothetical protein